MISAVNISMKTIIKESVNNIQLVSLKISLFCFYFFLPCHVKKELLRESVNKKKLDFLGDMPRANISYLLLFFFVCSCFQFFSSRHELKYLI